MGSTWELASRLTTISSWQYHNECGNVELSLHSSDVENMAQIFSTQSSHHWIRKRTSGIFCSSLPFTACSGETACWWNTVLASLLAARINWYWKKQLERERAFCGSQATGIVLMAGVPRWQGLEAAGYIKFTVQKQRAVNTCSHSTLFLHLHSQDPSQEMVPPIVSWSSCLS